MGMTRELKVLGCIMGGAVGDALGMPYVDKTRAEIEALGGVQDFRPALDTAPITVPLSALAEGEIGDPLVAGQWTDDTQLALALAETLIEQGGLFIPEAWAHKLVRWLNESPRAPGLSSLHTAVQLRTGDALWDEAADPDGAGCGAATRVAPVALLYADDTAKRQEIAVLQAQVTHGHPDAQAAALAVAEAVAWALPLDPTSLSQWSGRDFLTHLIDAVSAASPDFAEFANCLNLARALLMDEVETETAVRVLGVTAWSREAVPCALYLLARHPQNLESLLQSAVNLTGGATESIAALAGAIGGALHGVTALPPRWRRQIEDALRLIETALALANLRIGDFRLS